MLDHLYITYTTGVNIYVHSSDTLRGLEITHYASSKIVLANHHAPFEHLSIAYVTCGDIKAALLTSRRAIRAP